MPSRLVLTLLLLAPAAARADGVYELHPPGDVATVTGSYLIILMGYGYAPALIHPRCPCDPRELNPLDRTVVGNHSQLADVLSDVTVGAAVLVPLAYDARMDGFTRGLYDDAVVLVEVLGVNGALVTVVKDIVQRPLPRTYANDPSLLHVPGGYRSFYSGHTSTAFAALGYFAYTLGLHGVRGAWPWVLEVVVGTGVAAERVLAGRHFYTDVAVGAAVGALVGWAVPALHRRAGLSLSAVQVGEDGLAFGLSGSF